MPENNDRILVEIPDLTALAESTLTMREMYLSLRDSGFTADEATSILAKAIMVPVDKNSPDD